MEKRILKRHLLIISLHHPPTFQLSENEPWYKMIFSTDVCIADFPP